MCLFDAQRFVSLNIKFMENDHLYILFDEHPFIGCFFSIKKRHPIKGALHDYTRSTLPDLRARAETQTRFGFPSTRIRTF